MQKENPAGLSTPYKEPSPQWRCAQGDLLTEHPSSASLLGDRDAGWLQQMLLNVRKLLRVTANEKPEHLAT